MKTITVKYSERNADRKLRSIFWNNVGSFYNVTSISTIGEEVEVTIQNGDIQQCMNTLLNVDKFATMCGLTSLCTE